MDDLYREIILDHYKHPRNVGEIFHPSCSAEKDNPLCGDEFRMDLNIHNDKVIDVLFSGQGCAISTASASLLTEYIKDKKIKDLRRLSKDDIVNLLGSELTPARLKCALLPLEVIHTALKNYETKKR